VQTALMRCYPKWQRISKGDPDAYVRRSIFNLYASWWRRRWRNERATEQPPEVYVPGDVYAGLDERRVMVTALASLPPGQRAVIVLRFYEDLTEAQVAELLGCAVGTVKSQTAKALATLRSSGVLLSAEQTEVRHD